MASPLSNTWLICFPGVADIVFVCNEEHLNEPEFDLENTLARIRPHGRIMAIAPHKLGPVHAVLCAAEAIDLNRPTILNYCDFTCYWDFDHFKWFVETADCDGAIPAYTGFHPHMLGSTNYAYMKDRNGWVEDIQEKQPFTVDPMSEYASSGTYYFRSGEVALDYCQQMKDEGLAVKDEYYVSLAYRLMLRDNLKVAIYPLQHFMQWGTPEDVERYNVWSRISGI